VYKNPGNGEHTGTGLKHIDEWLDTATYLQSGQEYMELVNGVKKTLADMERYYPEYDGQAVELAGLVWFQGIADAASPSMAAEYQKHLTHLIHDLRKDLDKPKLPVVVASIGWSGTYATTVRDAQLAAGDPSNWVKSIDTRPFLHTAEVSPGSRPELYHQNAASFFDIGTAIANGMLEALR